MMSRVALSIGANSGDKIANIERVVVDIATHVGVVECRSSLYFSDAVGFESSNEFVNIALIVDSPLGAMELLKVIWEIERSYGREKVLIVEKGENRIYKDREMDIDIIFYGDMIIRDKYLTIPHPLMHERAFVLDPLAEIAPDMVHPKMKVTVKQLKDRLWSNM